MAAITFNTINTFQRMNSQPLRNNPSFGFDQGRCCPQGQSVLNGKPCGDCFEKGANTSNNVENLKAELKVTQKALEEACVTIATVGFLASPKSFSSGQNQNN